MRGDEPSFIDSSPIVSQSSPHAWGLLIFKLNGLDFSDYIELINPVSD
jgi:hypothetical protein